MIGAPRRRTIRTGGGPWLRAWGRWRGRAPPRDPGRRVRGAEGQDGPVRPHRRHRPRHRENWHGQHGLQHEDARLPRPPHRRLRRRGPPDAAAQSHKTIRNRRQGAPQAPTPPPVAFTQRETHVDRTVQLHSPEEERPEPTSMTRGRIARSSEPGGERCQTRDCRYGKYETFCD